MDSARHAQAGLQIRAARIERPRTTIKTHAPPYDEFYTLSPEMRDQLERKKMKELKELADVRKVLSSSGTDEPLHLKKLLQLKIFHIDLKGVKQHFEQKKKEYEQEYKLKFDAVEQTRKKVVDDQAKLDNTLAEIKEETAKLEEAKRVKQSDVHCVFEQLDSQGNRRG
jgi:hypothetical protein